MPHLGTNMAICAPGTPSLPIYGKVLVRCFAGYARAQSGTCGAPCWAGEFSGPQTRDDLVTHPTIAHMSSKWVLCPPHLSGYVQLFCTAGIVSVVGNGTCGDRCAPEQITITGATFNSPEMEHRARPR